MSSSQTLRNQASNQDQGKNLNQATVLLHESSERGDDDSVERILSSGRADINILVGGHRADRTALHKASSYGHTNIVKLLLKHGASADMLSSVQRTALHEACMGGHKDTLIELVKSSRDLNIGDNHGQTAAHIAAYHGETACLNVLIKHGCDLNCQDNQFCSPAHLAVMKNHPDTLRCLLDNSIDILQGDGQGRTAIHYAALYGSINCLKIFKESHKDLTITDNSGANPSHHASAGNHLMCLKFLTKYGIPLHKKDKFGKTLAHYAAQKGSTECLHWILEEGLDPSVTDDSGNTPAHCASAGHMEAMNCLVTHNSNMSLTNYMGDTPDILSRKHGQTVAYQKAVNGDIKCPFCVKKQKQLEYDLSHAPSEVEKNIKLEENVIFKSPIKTRGTRKLKSPQSKLTSTTRPSKRDLSSKYYGEHLFSLTTEQSDSTKQN